MYTLVALTNLDLQLRSIIWLENNRNLNEIKLQVRVQKKNKF